MAELEHPDEDILLDVVLGHADDDARHRVGGHLDRCAACQLIQAELLDGVDLTLAAVPRLAPPPGFESTTLARFGHAAGGRRPDADVAAVDRPSGAGPSPTLGDRPRHVPGRHRRGAWLVAAAAAALGVGIGVVGAEVLDARSQAPPQATEAWTAPLVAKDGVDVGGIRRAYDESGPRLVVVLTAAPAGADVTCRAALEDGTVLDLARWRTRGYDDAWVVDEPPGVRTLEIVTDPGRVWARAEL